MIDKPRALSPGRIGQAFGRLGDAERLAVNRSPALFPGPVVLLRRSTAAAFRGSGPIPGEAGFVRPGGS